MMAGRLVFCRLTLEKSLEVVLVADYPQLLLLRHLGSPLPIVDVKPTASLGHYTAEVIGYLAIIRGLAITESGVVILPLAYFFLLLLFYFHQFCPRSSSVSLAA